MDMCNFLRENGIMDVTEADCYFVMKFFDSDEDGKLNYPDFLQIVLPCTNAKIRSATTQRPMNECRPTDFLTLDVEQDLSRLLKMEVLMHRESEALKQLFESYLDYTPQAAYAAVDNSSIGFINIKTLDNFFKRHFTKGVMLEDNSAIIRRLDLDGDNKLGPEEFLKGIAAQEPFSKMLTRNIIKQEENFGAAYEKFQKDQKKLGVTKPKDPKAIRAHNEDQMNKFNQKQKLDRNFEEVSGVSPIACRHPVDLYGLKNSIGVFNPIMVENINKLPEPEEYEDPVVLKKMKSAEKKKNASKSPLKSSSKANIDQNKSPAKPAAKPTASAKVYGKVEKVKNPAAKLVLTN